VSDPDKLSLISNIAASYLRRNSVGVEQIGTVISSVTRAIEQAAKELAGETTESGAATTPAEEKPRPAVPIKRSVQHDHIVCLEDGMRAKTLKRHLQSAHGMTPQQYRERWGLGRDYPLVAPAYSEHRSQMAKKLGLGNRAAANGASAAAKRSRGGRSKKSAAAS
jgi:predicted transcriptional regulator